MPQDKRPIGLSKAPKSDSTRKKILEFSKMKFNMDIDDYRNKKNEDSLDKYWDVARSMSDKDLIKNKIKKSISKNKDTTYEVSSTNGLSTLTSSKTFNKKK